MDLIKVFLDIKEVNDNLIKYRDVLSAIVFEK